MTSFTTCKTEPIFKMEQIVTVDSVDDIINIFGKFDENVNRLQKQYSPLWKRRI